MPNNATSLIRLFNYKEDAVMAVANNATSLIRLFNHKQDAVMAVLQQKSYISRNRVPYCPRKQPRRSTSDTPIFTFRYFLSLGSADSSYKKRIIRRTNAVSCIL